MRIPLKFQRIAFPLVSDTIEFAANSKGSPVRAAIVCSAHSPSLYIRVNLPYSASERVSVTEHRIVYFTVSK